MKNIWNWFSLLGVKEELQEENSLTILYNRMGLFSAVGLLIFSIYMYKVDAHSLFIFITIGVSFVYSLVLILNGLNKIYWARLVTSFGTVLWVSIFHICFGGFFSQSLAVGAAIIINYVAFREKEQYLKLLFVLHAGVYFMALLYGIANGPIVLFLDFPPAGLVSFVISMSWVTLILMVFHQEKEKLIGNLISKNKELERTSRELERFSYIASHDLKSPLRTIISFGGMIKRDIEKGNYAAVNEKMSYVMTGAKQMNYIIQGILELSQLKNINSEERNEIDLNEILEKAKLNLRDEITQNNAKIRSDQLPLFLGNEVEFLLLFQNFIQNAIKYNKSEIPIINISSKIENDNLLISFKDNGIGIDQEFHEQVFEFFKRLHNSSEYEGTGIGLGLCKRIIDHYDGEISIDSQIGVGTTFTIHFPIKNKKVISLTSQKVEIELIS